MSTSQLPATYGQVTFPGQAAAPDGPCDLLPMFLIHHAFRRDLRMFAAAASATPVGDRATWGALDARWRDFARILHHHHSGEDRLLWPLLLARVDAEGNSAGRATLEAMAAEHEDIDPLLAGCGEGFARLASTHPADGGDDDCRAALVVRLAAARDRLGAHLGHEESDAMALLQQHLTQQEWHSLDKEFAKDYKPSDVLFALPWVLHDVPSEVWHRVRAFIGRPMVVAWRLGLRGPFERRERRAFRYVLPGRREPGGGVDRALVAALGVVVATDVVGGLVDVAAGRSTVGSAWGSSATLCAPLPMIVFQAVCVLLTVRAGRRTARVAAGLLAAACLASVVSGFFDGQLARADLSGGEIAFQVWLLAVTAVLGGLALARAVRGRPQKR